MILLRVFGGGSIRDFGELARGILLVVNKRRKGRSMGKMLVSVDQIARCRHGSIVKGSLWHGIWAGNNAILSEV